MRPFATNRSIFGYKWRAMMRRMNIIRAHGMGNSLTMFTGNICGVDAEDVIFCGEKF